MQYNYFGIICAEPMVLEDAFLCELLRIFRSVNGVRVDVFKFFGLRGGVF